MCGKIGVCVSVRVHACMCVYMCTCVCYRYLVISFYLLHYHTNNPHARYALEYHKRVLVEKLHSVVMASLLTVMSTCVNKHLLLDSRMTRPSALPEEAENE